MHIGLLDWDQTQKRHSAERPLQAVKDSVFCQRSLMWRTREGTKPKVNFKVGTQKVPLTSSKLARVSPLYHRRVYIAQIGAGPLPSWMGLIGAIIMGGAPFAWMVL